MLRKSILSDERRARIDRVTDPITLVIPEAQLERPMV
jgi:hypothetical protein